MDYDDPGWRGIVGWTALGLIPYVGFFVMRRHRQRTDPLTSMRVIYLSLVISLWIFGFLLLFVVPADRWFATEDAAWLPLIVTAIGIVSLMIMRWIRSRQLDSSSPERLVATYRGMFFIGIGVAAAPALWAFVATFLMSAWWIYLVGLVFSMIGLILVGPSRREITRRQRQIDAQGSPLSLGKALMGTIS